MINLWKLKKLAKNTFNFAINRIIQIIGMVVIIIGLLLLISLLSYSPEDPNFIFPENVIIQNILGFQGSFISDIFFQSFGLVSLFIPFSFIFTGINIFLSKKLILIVESLFFTSLYSLSGSLFFSNFYPMHLNFT